MAASTRPAQAEQTHRAPPMSEAALERPGRDELSNLKKMLPQIVDHICEILKKKRNTDSRR